MTKQYKSLGRVELKIDGDAGTFRATIATLNVIDKDGDVTVPGAFRKGQEVRIAQWGHNWGALPVGKGVIGADDHTAWVDGQFFLDTEHGKQTYLTVKGLGDLQEWSYGYYPAKYSYGEFEKQQVRFLEDLDSIEASPVMLGVGEGTGTDMIKGLNGGLTLPDHADQVLAGLEAFKARVASLAGVRAKEGRTLSTANVNRLKGHREALATIVGDLDALLADTEPKGLLALPSDVAVRLILNGVL